MCLQNVVLFAGTAADRDAIHEHEWRYVCDGRRNIHRWKFTVLLTSYETVRQESSLFRSVQWTTVIVDEAHRLKMVNSQARKAILSLSMQWLLLLTGPLACCCCCCCRLWAVSGLPTDAWLHETSSLYQCGNMRMLIHTHTHTLLLIVVKSAPVSVP